MLEKLTLEDSIDKLKRKEISALELTEAVLKSIQSQDEDINAYITVTSDEAIKTARIVDDKRIRGEELNDLAGVPLAVKDNMSTRGIRTTAGSKILSGYVPPFDATVIRGLREKDAVIVGKANMDEFAMGASTESSYFGPTKNPCDLTRVPGGSSGGSAAAVAADEAIYALGSDTGGSIRQPASFCGVVGLKPTYGRVSRWGLLAMGSSLDQIGPLTKTVKDAATVLENIAGPDRHDATSVSIDVPKYSQGLGRDIKGLRIGLPQEYFEGLDPQIAENIHKAVEELVKQGAEVIDVSLPYSKYALAVYYIITPCEVSSNLARYDGIKYGYSSKEAKTLVDTYFKSRAEGLGLEPKRRSMIGSYALSSGYYDAYYLKAQKVRTLVKRDFDEAFKKVDVLITPTSPILPFKIGEKAADPLAMYLADIDTVPVNIAGVPAISVPVEPVMGFPVGMQIIGPQWSEETILNVAYAYEQRR